MEGYIRFGYIIEYLLTPDEMKHNQKIDINKYNINVL